MYVSLVNEKNVRTSCTHLECITMFIFWNRMSQLLKNQQEVKEKEQQLYFPLFGKDKYKILKCFKSTAWFYMYMRSTHVIPYCTYTGIQQLAYGNWVE